MLEIEKLPDLNNLGRGRSGGIDKKWPLRNELEYELLHDYLQKVNFSIQDFNGILNTDSFLIRDKVILLVCRADWIADSVFRAMDCFREDVISGFSFSKQGELIKARDYLRAVRSFVVAHPLGTSSHKTYGFDGDLICVDIQSCSSIFMMRRTDNRCLTLEGMVESASLEGCDFIAKAYSKKDGAAYSCCIGFNLRDLRYVAATYIEKLYELDEYLDSLKRADFRDNA